VADVVRSVVNSADMGESDHADDEKTQSHRQHSLSDNVRADSDIGETGGLGLLHLILAKIFILARNKRGRDPNFSVAGSHPGSLGGNSLSLPGVSAAILRVPPPETPPDGH
jgi:hypothetical protein